MTSRFLKNVPQYGWDARTLYDAVVVTDMDLVADGVARLPGLFEVAVRVVMDNVGGAGTVNVILEGSNTGDDANPNEWFFIASLNDSDLFDVGGVFPSARILGLSPLQGGSGNVNIGRFNYLRLRAEIVSGAPTFEIAMTMSGIAGDGQKLTKDITVISLSGDPNEQESAYIRRPEGTRWLTVTALLQQVILDPGPDGFNVNVQYALDEEAAIAGKFGTFSQSFVDLAAVGDATLIETGVGLPALDMGPYNYFRLQIRNANGALPTDLSSYTILGTFAFDTVDWQSGEIGVTQLATQIQRQSLQVVFDPDVYTDLAANPITVTGQFLDANGLPFTTPTFAPRRAIVVLSSTANGAQLTLHGAATASGSEAPSQGATPAVQYVVQADDDGRFSIDVASGGVPTTVYVSLINYVDRPGATRKQYVLMNSEVATLNFT